jgi:hypothetical protein
VTPGATAALSTEAARLTAQYEALRSAALGEPLAPTARHGLVVFLRRGMWAWARALVAAPAAPTRLSRATTTGPEPDHLHGVVRVFATMALSSPDRRV